MVLNCPLPSLATVTLGLRFLSHAGAAPLNAGMTAEAAPNCAPPPLPGSCFRASRVIRPLMSALLRALSSLLASITALAESAVEPARSAAFCPACWTSGRLEGPSPLLLPVDVAPPPPPLASPEGGVGQAARFTPAPPPPAAAAAAAAPGCAGSAMALTPPPPLLLLAIILAPLRPSLPTLSSQAGTAMGPAGEPGATGLMPGADARG